MSANRHARRAYIATANRRRSWEWQTRDIDPALIARSPAVQRVSAVLVNDFYIVQIYDVHTQLGKMFHLAIRTLDGNGEPPWRDMQRIKNELVGEDFEAVQVYPRDLDVTDAANMYHLFVLPISWPLPFGLHRENGFVKGGAR